MSELTNLIDEWYWFPILIIGIIIVVVFIMIPSVNRTNYCIDNVNDDLVGFANGNTEGIEDGYIECNYQIKNISDHKITYIDKTVIIEYDKEKAK